MNGRRRFPEGVPLLVDPRRSVLLRAPARADLPAVVEQCRDPEMTRFTTVPVPYGMAEAQSFLTDVVAPGWEAGDRLSWAIEADRGDGRAFCGSVDLRLTGRDEAEIGFGLHPAARGRGLMS